MSKKKNYVIRMEAKRRSWKESKQTVAQPQKLVPPLFFSNLERYPSKKRGTGCSDCHKKSRQSPKQLAEAEAARERALNLQRREERVMEAELRHQAQEDAQNRRENELNRLALDLGQREAKLLVREAKHEEEARALKRRREAADNASSAKQKLFCDLGQRRKQQLVTTAISTLSSLSRSTPEELLAAVTTRITRGEDSKVQLEELRVKRRRVLPRLPPIPAREEPHRRYLVSGAHFEGRTRAHRSGAFVYFVGTQRGAKQPFFTDLCKFLHFIRSQQC